MNQFLSIISDIRVVIGIAVVVILLAIWLGVEKSRTKKYRKELEELEQRYTALKSIPLSFKMNKAVTVSKLNNETNEKMKQANTKFDRIQSNVTSISNLLADTEDYILIGKLRKADEGMSELEKELSLTEKDVRELDQLLDDILAKETAQRQEVTTYKNRFRALKSQASENASALSYCWNAVEQKIVNTEKMFSTFEEWMFSSDYDKANRELQKIQTTMSELDTIIDVMPSLLEQARGVIPQSAETLQRDYSRCKSRGVYLKHLNIEENLSAIKNGLGEDVKNLKEAKYEGVAENLESYQERLAQMSESIQKEDSSFNEMKKLYRQTEELARTTNENAKFVEKAYSKNSSRFGLQNMSEQLQQNLDALKQLNDQAPSVLDNVKTYQVPASTVLSSLNQLSSGLSEVNDSLSSMRNMIEAASGDEDRARKQLIKLQIIMNQMQVKIRKYKLPNISAAYEEDMGKANQYMYSISKLMEENPMNRQLLASTLQEALDFIYKLYNNVNNVVGTVVMVENTIVFGNRYRSTYEDIDSELTRSELSFRNGEYTQALTIAIETIEKIHPGNYESMIKENAKGAE